MIPRLLAAVALVAVVAGCGVFTAPPPTAGDHTDIVGTLVLRGMTITDEVSGDSGCDSHVSDLHSNAVRYDVRPPGDSNSYAVYVFGWDSQATFDADQAAFNACAQANQPSSGTSVDTVAYLPWRAYGYGWPPGLEAAVDLALKQASGIPPPVEPE